MQSIYLYFTFVYYAFPHDLQYITHNTPFLPFFFQVPDDANKSLWLPKTDNGSMYSSAVKKEETSSSTTYATCEMYKNPQNHSLGTQPCVDGYEFHMDNNEWNIISEVKIACVCLLDGHHGLLYSCMALSYRVFSNIAVSHSTIFF